MKKNNYKKKKCRKVKINKRLFIPNIDDNLGKKYIHSWDSFKKIFGTDTKEIYEKYKNLIEQYCISNPSLELIVQNELINLWNKFLNKTAFKLKIYYKIFDEVKIMEDEVKNMENELIKYNVKLKTTKSEKKKKFIQNFINKFDPLLKEKTKQLKKKKKQLKKKKNPLEVSKNTTLKDDFKKKIMNAQRLPLFNDDDVKTTTKKKKRGEGYIRIKVHKLI